jgi:hypothetical protein
LRGIAAQGFLIAPPLPAAHVRYWAERWRSRDRGQPPGAPLPLPDQSRAPERRRP